MAQPKTRLYQRLRTKGFPWVACEMAKNGSPKPHPDAFQFGIRYTIDGQRKLDPAATLDEAVTMQKAANVRLYANQNGVQMPGRPGSETPASRTTIADAVTTYFQNLIAQGKDPKTIKTYRVAVDGFVASCSKSYFPLNNRGTNPPSPPFFAIPFHFSSNGSSGGLERAMSRAATARSTPLILERSSGPV